jgi:phytoene dehydrogenase-like protein
MSDCDYLVVGSGINALVAASLLGRNGHRVLVLERNPVIGGCIRTEEITAPGFLHDVMATTFVLFLLSPAYAALSADLEARGLSFSHADLPTGVLRPDGSHVVFSKDRVRNIVTLESLAAGDGESFAREMDALGADAPFLFSLLGGSLWSGAMVKMLAREAWRRGPRGLAAWFGEALTPARAYLETRYASDAARALWAPWVLHTGLGPESAYSGAMAKVIAFAIEAAGCPIVTGGAVNLLRAFERLITDLGGQIRTGADVVAIEPGPNGRAGGVRLAHGERLTATAGVVCSTTPNQLYGSLLKDWPGGVPAAIGQAVKAFRYGKGNMQVHYALDAPPRWKGGAELGRVALLHLTPGLDGVSRAANEAERGLLPAEPTICVGQPTALDPSRAPEGKAILWLQLPEAPRVLKGDAAGEIAVPADGGWTDAVRERYADRVEARLAGHIEGFRESIVARRAYSPADLEAMNVNLVGGDPYGGFCGLDQFFLWRPFKTSVNHRTFVDGLYHIGASTHPGPGLGGGSGFLLANSLKPARPAARTAKAG